MVPRAPFDVPICTSPKPGTRLPKSNLEPNPEPGTGNPPWNPEPGTPEPHVYTARMLTILVTNDDGVQSDGIHALAAALASLGEVTIVAPMTEASAIGHALTLRRPLRIEEVSANVFSVDGTPTDCVNLAVTTVLKSLPDLVVSGINKGYNIGDDVTYSGTVAGALEAALLGIPAMAVSLQGGLEYDFTYAAGAAFTVAEALLRHPLAGRAFLNVNVPRGRIRGFRTAVQARRNHVTSVSARVDPRGREDLLDRRGPGRLAAARRLGLPGGGQRDGGGDAAAPGPHGARATPARGWDGPPGGKCSWPTRPGRSRNRSPS